MFFSDIRPVASGRTLSRVETCRSRRHDGRSPRELDARGAAAEEGLAAVDLLELSCDLRLDVRALEHLDEVLVQHRLRMVAVDDGAEAELWPLRGADLAGYDDVERTRDLVGDGHAATGTPGTTGPSPAQRRRRAASWRPASARSSNSILSFVIVRRPGGR